MARTRIKICGITRPEDARAAVSSGADAIGLVFYPDSPRAVTLAQAKAVAAVVPPLVSLVALFVDALPQDVEDVLAQVPVSLLQFHGQEDAAFCAQFQRPWMKAIRVRDDIDVTAACAPFSAASGVLLDAWQDGVPGGTGKTFDWSRAQGTALPPIVLAGGLNAGNVGEAMQALSPWAVDVSGGVEASPGIKDAAKIQAFTAAVYAADQQ